MSASASAGGPEGGAGFTPAVPQSDLDARLAAVQKELGSGVKTAVVGGTFLFVSPDRGPLFDAAVQNAGRALPLLFEGRFDHPPERGVTVYAFSNEEKYLDDCDGRFHVPCETPFGQYRADGRVIECNLARGWSTVLHEMVHALVQRDAPRAPRWLSEGLGALFEAPTFSPPGEIHGITNWRLPALQQALGTTAGQREVRLERLFEMSAGGFGDGGKVLLHEAMARYLCQWLDEQRLLWPFYRAWRDGQAADPTGERAFLAIVGVQPAQATDRWRSWLGKLVFRPAGG